MLLPAVRPRGLRASGRSNVVWWLEKNGLEPTEERIEKVFQAAKRSTRLLEDSEIRAILAAS